MNKSVLFFANIFALTLNSVYADHDCFHLDPRKKDFQGFQKIEKDSMDELRIPLSKPIHQRNLDIPDIIEKDDLFTDELSSFSFQKKLLSENFSDLKTVDLQRLIDLDLVLTHKSLLNLQKNWQQSLMQLDLFEENNWAKATKAALQFLQSDASLTEAYAAIQNNESTCAVLQQILQSLDRIIQTENFHLEDETCYQEMVELSLQSNQFLADITSLLSDKAPLVHFWSDFIKVLQVIFSRYGANQIMNQLREKAEKALNENQKSTKISAQIRLPFLGKLTSSLGNAAAGLIASATEGSTDSSLYTMDVGTEGFVNIEADIGSLHFGAKAAVDTVKSALFFSLEQFLDSGKSTLKLTGSDWKNLIKSRKDTKATEEELLRRFGELEGFYKIFQVIPQKVAVNWDDISQSLPVDTIRTYGLSGKLDASLKEALGLSLLQTIECKYYTRHRGLLSLITDDCLPAENLTLNDLIDKIGQNYNLSEKMVSPQVLYGHLYAYNATLEQLANDHASTQTNILKDRKHQYESLLAPSKKRLFKKTPGRREVLRSGVLTAAAMRESTDSLLTFPKIYQQLCHLSQMQKFSKNALHRNSTIPLTSKVYTSSTHGTMSVEVPTLGKVGLELTKSKTKGHPIQSENGDKACVELIFPNESYSSFFTQKILEGVQSLINRFKGWLGTEDLPVILPKTLDLESDEVDEKSLLTETIKEKAKVTIVKEISSILDAVYQWLVNSNKIEKAWDCLIDALPDIFPGTSVKISIPLAKVENNLQNKSLEESDLLPLPGQNLIVHTQDQWIPQSVQMSTVFAGEVGIKTKSLNFGIQKTEAKKAIKLGNDTLGALVAKFNALCLGSDALEAETFDLTNFSSWQNFKKEHQGELSNLLINLANQDSNSRYELQGVFNAVMHKIPTPKQEQCSQDFASLLKNCDQLKDTTIFETEGLISKIKEQNLDLLNRTSADLDKTLEYNFQYNFLPNYNKVS